MDEVNKGKACPWSDIETVTRTTEEIIASFENVIPNACLFLLNKTFGPLIDEVLSGVMSIKDFMYEVSKTLQAAVNSLDPKAWKMYAMSTQMDMLFQMSKREAFLLSAMKGRISRMKRYLGDENNKKLEDRIKKLCEKYNAKIAQYDNMATASQKKAVIRSALQILETLMAILKADSPTAIGKAYNQAKSALRSREDVPAGTKLKGLKLDKDIVMAKYNRNVLDAEYVTEVFGGFFDLVKLFSGTDLSFMTERIILQLNEVNGKINAEINGAVNTYIDGLCDVKAIAINEVKKIKPRNSLSSIKDSIPPKTGSIKNPKSAFSMYTLYGTDSGIESSITALDLLDSATFLFADGQQQNTVNVPLFNAGDKKISEYEKFSLESRLMFAALKIDPLRYQLKKTSDEYKANDEQRALEEYSVNMTSLIEQLSDVDYQSRSIKLTLQILTSLPALMLGSKKGIVSGLDSIEKILDELFVSNQKVVKILSKYKPYKNSSIESTLKLIDDLCGEDVSNAMATGQAFMQKVGIWYSWVGHIFETIETIDECVNWRILSKLKTDKNAFSARRDAKQKSSTIQQLKNDINELFRNLMDKILSVSPFDQNTLNKMISSYQEMKEKSREFEEFLERIIMLKKAYDEAVKLAETLKEKI